MNTATLWACFRPENIVPSRGLRRAWTTVLVLNALDLSSSHDLAGVDGAEGIAARSAFGCAIQVLLLLPLIRHVPAVYREALSWLRSLPISPGVRWPLALVFAIQLGHVALRREIYPFTPVGMFSNVELDLGDAPRFDRIYLVNNDRVNFMRESSMLFAQHGLSLDIKAAWLLRIHATGLGRTYGVIADEFSTRHVAPPLIAEVWYSATTGRVIRERVMGVPPGYAPSVRPGHRL